MLFRKTIVTGLLSLTALAINALPSMARPAMIDPDQRAGVNVRSEPSVDSTALDGLLGGTSIEVLNISPNRWYYVRSTGSSATEGWVAGELIRFNRSSATYGTLAGSLGDTINIRSAPSTTSSILHTGVTGDLVSVGRSALVSGYRWYVVVYPNGSSGWVRADLISVWPKGCIITCPAN
jgi:uncharacterized protein YgiM (DUF1202 family)